MKVFLMGGAGNEFFQLARAHYLSKLGFQASLVDLRGTKKMFYRLIGFTYHKPWLEIKDVADHLDLEISKPSFQEYLILAVIFFLRKLGFSHGFNRSIIDDNGNISLRNLLLKFDIGYFQSKSHIGAASIEAVADAIITTLKITHQENTQQIIVHVRGGDVADKNKISDQDAKAIVNYCIKKNIKLSCVSNDSKYSRSKFSGLDYDVMSKGLSAMDDFISLSGAKKMYVSNSTFAFWAAICARQLSTISLFGPTNWEFNDFIKVQSIHDN